MPIRFSRDPGRARTLALPSVLALAVPALVVACSEGEALDSSGGLSFGPGGGGDAVGGSDAAGTVGTLGGADGGGSLGGSGMVDGTADGGDNGEFCTDMDNDGYGPGCNAGDDCDDDNPGINPGATETCDGIDENCNDEIDDGCECPDDGVSGNCNIPTDLGALDVGAVVMGIVGNVPADNGIDWYKVDFPLADVRPGAGTPTIEFEINEEDQFVFDVVQNQCDATGVPCTSGGTGGVGVSLTSWSFVDDDMGCCTAPDDSMVPWPAPIYIRVYRTTSGPSCATYQLKVTR